MFFMGVLKNLTDEYFEKTLRNEDGKFLYVDGCRVVVPSNFEEKDFLELVQKIISISCNFDIFIKYEDKKDKYTKYTHIECKGGLNMFIYSFERCMKYYKNIFNEDINKTIYDSTVKYLEHIMKDVMVIKYRTLNYIELSNDIPDDKDFLSKILKELCSRFNLSSSDFSTSQDKILLKPEDYMLNVELSRLRNAKNMCDFIKKCYKMKKKK